MPYTDMSDWRRFAGDVARPGVLGTVRADGSPHTAPVWFDFDGDEIVFTTGESTAKGRNLKRALRASLCVQDDRPPFSFAVVEGPVTLSDDADDLRRWAAQIGGRYMGAERADEFGARNGVPGELLVRLRPVKVVAKEDVAD